MSYQDTTVQNAPRRALRGLVLLGSAALVAGPLGACSAQRYAVTRQCMDEIPAYMDQIHAATGLAVVGGVLGGALVGAASGAALSAGQDAAASGPTPAEQVHACIDRKMQQQAHQ